MVQDEVIFYGHPNVQSSHKKSIQITRESSLSLRGDCVIGVRANKGCSDLNPSLRQALVRLNSIIGIELIVEDISFAFNAQGSNLLTLLDKKDIVIRRSAFCCPRTLSILCNKASSDLPRKMIELLKSPETKGLLLIRAE